MSRALCPLRLAVGKEAGGLTGVARAAITERLSVRKLWCAPAL